MKVSFLTTHLPPDYDGIADYVHGMAAGLLPRCELAVFHPRGREYQPIPGARLIPAFELGNTRSLRGVPELVAAERPDWFIPQLLPLNFGGSSIGNTDFLRMLREVKRRSPGTRIGLVVHERTPQILHSRNPLRRLWIRKRLDWAVCSADAAFFLVEAWAKDFAARFPRTAVHALHLGTTFEAASATDREAVRTRYGIHPGAIVLGLFGRGDSSRLMDHVRAARAAAASGGAPITVLHVGRDDGDTARLLADLGIIATGPIPKEEVAAHFAAMDVFLAPYADGVSTRRTSLMTALALGVPVVGTRGPATSEVWLGGEGRALMLADAADPGAFGACAGRVAGLDPSARAEIARQGRALYLREFTYDKAAEKMIRALEGTSGPGGSAPTV